MAGFVSQNWVRRRWPPGELRQQVSYEVVLWQLKGASAEHASEPAVAQRAAATPRSRYLAAIMVQYVADKVLCMMVCKGTTEIIVVSTGCVIWTRLGISLPL